METLFKVVIEDDWIVENRNEQTEFPSNHHTLGICNDYEDRDWRIKKFMDFLCNCLSDAALTRQRENELVAQSAHYSILIESFQNLKKCLEVRSAGDGGEIAEILLYGIMRKYYGAIAAVPKIFYKQNQNVPVHGADSVHILTDESKGKFSLWYGEAKFYQDFNSALPKLLESVKNSLDRRAIRKENKILLALKDLDYAVANVELRNKIITFLDENTSLDEIKCILHIPMLLLCESSIVSAYEKFSDECREKFKEEFTKIAEKYFSKQNEELGNITGYGDIHFHLILFPIKSKDEIYKYFVDLQKKFDCNE